MNRIKSIEDSGKAKNILYQSEIAENVTGKKKSKRKTLNKFYDWFEIIEDDYEFLLACYGLTINEGMLYHYETKLCKTTKCFLNILSSIHQWEENALSYTRTIDREDSPDESVVHIENILTEVVKKGNEVVCIEKEEIKVSEIKDRVNSFIKKVNESFIPKIHEFQDKINTAINNATQIFPDKKCRIFRIFQNADIKTWNTLLESLQRQEEKLNNILNLFSPILKN